MSEAEVSEEPKSTPYLPQLLPYVCALLGGGVYGGVAESIHFFGIALLLGALAAIAISAFLRSTLRVFAIGAIVAVALFVGGFYYADSKATPAESDVILLYPEGAKELLIEGVVIEGTPSVTPRFNPDPNNGLPRLFQGRDLPSRSFLLEIESAPESSNDRVSGVIRVFAKSGVDIRAGFRVRVRGDLKGTQVPTNPGEFDARPSMRRRGISAALFTKKPADIEVLESEFSLRGHAESYRDHVFFKVGRDLEFGNAPLLAAIALGERSTLSSSTREAFMRTGTVHMLVVSGLHVLVMVWLVGYLLRFLGVRSLIWREITRMTIAAAFLFISGGHIATLRAVVMVWVFSLSSIRGRGHDFLSSLSLAALCVFLLNPLDITSEGFALSFITVLAFALVLPLLDRPREEDIEEREPSMIQESVRQSLRSTFVASLISLPLVVYRWNIVTPVALVVNVFGMIPIVVILGASIFLPLADVEIVAALLVWVFDLMIGLLRAIVEFSSNVKGVTFYLPTPPLWWVFAAYGLYAFSFAFYRFSSRSGRMAFLSLLPLVLALGLLAVVGPKAPPTPTLTILDVRHGNASFVHLPDGKCVLFDCGSQGRSHAGSTVIANALLQKGIQHIDLLVLSHAHSPAVNGVPALLSKISIGEVWLTPDFSRSRDGLEAEKWLEANIPLVTQVEQGEVRQIGDALLKVHWPLSLASLDEISVRKDRADTSSLVVSLTHEDTTMLYTGGIDDMALRKHKKKMPECDLLFAPRNGGKLKQGRMLGHHCFPDFIAISARANFVKPQTIKDYRECGAGILKTYAHGAIEIPLQKPLEPTSFVQDGGKAE